MKYNIMGFSQEAMVKHNLKVQHVMILRWFVDFQGSGKMSEITANNKNWHWIKYSGIIEEFPSMDIKSTRQIARLLSVLCENKIMEKYIYKKNGTFSYYRLSHNYKELVTSTEMSEPTTLMSNGIDNNVHRGLDNNVQTNDPSTIHNPSTKNQLVPKNKTTKFIKPTIDELKAYIFENKYTLDAEKFIDYYESKGWLVGKSNMKNWKATVRNWQRNQKEFAKSNTTSKANSCPIYTDDDDFIAKKDDTDYSKFNGVF